MKCCLNAAAFEVFRVLLLTMCILLWPQFTHNLADASSMIMGHVTKPKSFQTGSMNITVSSVYLLVTRSESSTAHSGCEDLHRKHGTDRLEKVIMYTLRHMKSSGEFLNHRSVYKRSQYSNEISDLCRRFKERGLVNGDSEEHKWCYTQECWQNAMFIKE